MKTNLKAEFKRWQVLPALSHPLDESTATSRVPECRGPESAGPSPAMPGRVECPAASSRKGKTQPSGRITTILIPPRQ
jgi:hypothetical protein